VTKYSTILGVFDRHFERGEGPGDEVGKLYLKQKQKTKKPLKFSLHCLYYQAMQYPKTKITEGIERICYNMSVQKKRFQL